MGRPSPSHRAASVRSEGCGETWAAPLHLREGSYIRSILYSGGRDMRYRRQIRWMAIIAGLLWMAGSLPLQARDKDEMRDRIRSIRAGTREILTLAQASIRLDVKPK